MKFAKFGCPGEDKAFPIVVSVKTLGGDVFVDLTGKRLDRKRWKLQDAINQL